MKMYFFALVVTVTFVYTCDPICSVGNVSSVALAECSKNERRTAQITTVQLLRYILHLFIISHLRSKPNCSEIGAENMPSAIVRKWANSRKFKSLRLLLANRRGRASSAYQELPEVTRTYRTPTGDLPKTCRTPTGQKERPAHRPVFLVVSLR